jgi:hypothetical protein
VDGAVTDEDDLPVRSRLADRIAAAFATVPRPEPPVTEGHGPLNDDVESALAGKAAGDVTAADAREVRTDLGYLRADAFAYYVPALARIALLCDEDVDGLEQSIVGLLTPPDDPAARAAFEQRIGQLDGAQRGALASFVRWYCDSESFVPERDRALAFWAEPS